MSVIKTKESKTVNDMQKTVSIDLIKVDKNNRLRATGDITPIKNSIESLGMLINPITIDTDYNLIAGYHRYLASKELDMKEIPVNVVSKEVNKKFRFGIYNKELYQRYV